MKKLVAGLSFLLLLVACKDKNRLPSNVLPRLKMQAVLWDLIEAGEYVNGYLLNKDTSLDAVGLSQKWYEKVYAIHKIDRKTFDRSYKYYREHPALMREMLDSISKRETNPIPVAPTDKNIITPGSTTPGGRPVFPVDSSALKKSQQILKDQETRNDTMRRRYMKNPSLRLDPLTRAKRDSINASKGRILKKE